MSFDFRVRNFCDHFVYREQLFLEDDLLTLIVPRPVASRSEFKLYVDGDLKQQNDPVFGHSLVLQEFYNRDITRGSDKFRAYPNFIIILNRKFIILDSLTYVDSETGLQEYPSNYFTVSQLPDGTTLLEPSELFPSNLQGENFTALFNYEVTSPENVQQNLIEVQFDQFLPSVTTHIFEVTYPTDVVNCRKCFGFGVITDIEFDSLGQARTVENTEKLIQDSFIFTFTELDSDPFFSYIGTTINQIIGRKFIQGQTDSRIVLTTTESLEALQELQNIQVRVQEVTDEETLQALRSVDLTQDEDDPTLFYLDVNIRSTVNPSLEISSTLRFSRVS